MSTFKARLDIIGINPFVFVPEVILSALFKKVGSDKGHIPVCGQVNGKPYEQTLLRYKGEWRLYINTTMLPDSPKRIGELIDVSIELDQRDRTLQPHPDLTKALAKNKEAAAVFQELPPSGQKEIIRYISNLKTAESREKNIKQAIGFLLGKNRFMGRDAIKPSTPVTSSDAPGQAAVHYDQFYGPLFFEPYAIEVAKRIIVSADAVVLEIAAGTGRVTRHIRERIPPSAKLIASDINDDMLAIAKKKSSHLDIYWQNIDAQRLPFDDNSIDLVVCCFGYMFVPDRPKAFAEAYRILKPGGQLLFTTWDKLENNGASYISRSTALSYLEAPLPESYNLATSMNDEAIIKPLLQDAGFSKISIEKLGLSSVSPTAKEATNGLIAWGPIYEAIKKLDPTAIDEIKVKVEKELAEKFGAAPMVAPMSAVICQAWK